MSGGAVFYADADVNPRPAGIVAIGKKADNTLKAFILDANGNLQVYVAGAAPIVNTSDPYRGTSSYSAGASGTVVVAAGARVVSLSAHATIAGTLTIFGGANNSCSGKQWF